MSFMDTEVVAVLKEIREEAKQTNARLDDLNESVKSLGRRQVESELRLSTEVLSLADVTREVRDLLARKHDDHDLVLDLVKRVEILESRRPE